MATKADAIESSILYLVKDWGESGESINRGGDGTFAAELLELLEGRAEARVIDDDYFSGGGWLKRGTYGPSDRAGAYHEWVYSQGLHYDAETPKGVEDWISLPYFQRMRARGYEPIGRKSVEQEKRLLVLGDLVLVRAKEFRPAIETPSKQFDGVPGHVKDAVSLETAFLTVLEAHEREGL